MNKKIKLRYQQLKKERLKVKQKRKQKNTRGKKIIISPHNGGLRRNKMDLSRQ